MWGILCHLFPYWCDLESTSRSILGEGISLLNQQYSKLLNIFTTSYGGRYSVRKHLCDHRLVCSRRNSLKCQRCEISHRSNGSLHLRRRYTCSDSLDGIIDGPRSGMMSWKLCYTLMIVVVILYCYDDLWPIIRTK